MPFLLLVLLAGPVHPMGMTAMKSVVCKQVDDAQGKSGAELAQAIESNYALAALLPGDPPIACFRSTVDSSSLPRGAR